MANDRVALTQARMVDILDDRQRLDLFIVEALLDVKHRSSRYADLGQELNPLLGSPLGQVLLYFDGQLLTVGQTAAAVDEAWIVEQLGRPQRLTEASVEPLAASLDDQAGTVLGLVDAGWRRDRVVVAGLAGDFAFDQVERRLELHQPNHRLEQ